MRRTANNIFFPNTLPKAANAVHGWHFDHKSKYVVNEGVESLWKLILTCSLFPIHDMFTL